MNAIAARGESERDQPSVIGDATVLWRIFAADDVPECERANLVPPARSLAAQMNDAALGRWGLLIGKWYGPKPRLSKQGLDLGARRGHTVP